ncbi:hypothetical protein D9M71_604130 [compost metagenome]
MATRKGSEVDRQYIRGWLTGLVSSSYTGAEDGISGILGSRLARYCALVLGAAVASGANTESTLSLTLSTRDFSAAAGLA